MDVAPSGRPRDITLGLPDELLLEYLAYLPQPALLMAAHVSRRWRAIARTLPNYYRFYSLVFPDYTELELSQIGGDGAIAMLKSVVDDVVMIGYKLSLRIYVGADEYPAYHFSFFAVSHPAWLRFR
ncbi:hypothetical protein AURDEDRAFT_175630 [Auricularia subglabra TFB-10046 SS5]|uniref:F-box domain-containing protein n=1 Tax=Auricularia subglabra (strain TFB-10046 / SS5) TaxID=717982 RepID=J0CX79_AURST|nr:hypothetical protein AURDEDRAFT_175630 [Auricularia subglabra TFB-10046 SS5]